MMSITGENFKQICEVTVPRSGWFDMESPCSRYFCNHGFLLCQFQCLKFVYLAVLHNFFFFWNAQLCLIFMNMSSYWWVGPISSINLSNVHTKKTNNTTQTGLRWILWDQVTLYNFNIFRVSINVSEQSFPN